MPASKKAVCRIVAAAALCIAPAAPSLAAKVTGSCEPTALKYIFSDKFNSTSNGSFVRVPEMSIQIVIGGTKPSCIIVDFQAIAHAANAGNELVSLDARLDDNDNDDYLTANQPQFAASDGMWSVVRSIKFIWKDVAPGTHKIQIYYRSANGGSVELNNPTMVVHYER